MTYLEMEMKELGRSTWNNTHNMTLLIRTHQEILQLEEASMVEEYKHTHTHTYTYTHTYTLHAELNAYW